MLVNCCMCGKEFEVSAEEAREWADTFTPFDPTDWECEECEAAFWAAQDED